MLLDEILEVLHPPDGESLVLAALRGHELAEGVKAKPIRLLVYELYCLSLINTLDYYLGISAARGEVDVVRAPGQIQYSSFVTRPSTLAPPLF